MERTPVISSNLKSVGYDSGTSTLEVEFKKGRIYQYQNVPPEKYSSLLDADSKGRYFNKNIKDLYPFVRIRS